MSTGYTRQSAGDIVTGGTIMASHFNAEYNQLQSAFDATSGHNHDGTTGGGAPLGTTALGALTNTSAGIIVANGADDFVVRTLTAPAAGITVTNGTGVSGNPTLALANDLAALEAMSSTGIVTRTGSETYAQRTITGTANEITLTNGDGVSGNPTISLPSALTFTGKTITGGTFSAPTLTLNDNLVTIRDNSDTTKQAVFECSTISTATTRTYTFPDASGTIALTSNLSAYQPLDATLTALAAYSTNGIVTQTASDTFTGRTITGTANEITVANGDGVSGNPTLSLPSALTFTGKTVTGGTFNLPTLACRADITTIQDQTDGTKKAAFNCASISTATTRSYTFPDANGTIALTSNLSAYLPLTGGTITDNLTLNRADSSACNFIMYNTTSGSGGSDGARLYFDGTNMRVQNSEAGTLTLWTSNTSRVEVGSGGHVKFTGITTTASAANAFLDSGDSNNLLRSTSSLRYKTGVEDIDYEKVENLISNARCIWYRSTALADNPAWGWYGLIAEELAEIEPALVQWSYPYKDVEVTEMQENKLGELEEVTYVKSVPDKDQPMIPDGIQYDRLTVFLLAEVQKLRARVEALEAANGNNL